MVFPKGLENVYTERWILLYIIANEAQNCAPELVYMKDSNILWFAKYTHKTNSKQKPKCINAVQKTKDS